MDILNYWFYLLHKKLPIYLWDSGIGVSHRLLYIFPGNKAALRCFIFRLKWQSVESSICEMTDILHCESTWWRKHSSAYCLWVKTVAPANRYLLFHGFLKIKGNYPRVCISILYPNSKPTIVILVSIVKKGWWYCLMFFFLAVIEQLLGNLRIFLLFIAAYCWN